MPLRRTVAGIVTSASIGTARLVVLVLAAGCGTSSARAAPDGAADARQGLSSVDCPLSSQVAACQPAPTSACTDPALGCAPDALPTGLGCAGDLQCSMAIDPCPGSPRYAGGERIDIYVCTCASGRWKCVDCFEGASLCVESPDGSLYFGGGADAGRDADAGGDADAGADAGADAAPDSPADASLSD
jgi:hypothetical protein